MGTESISEYCPKSDGYDACYRRESRIQICTQQEKELLKNEQCMNGREPITQAEQPECPVIGTCPWQELGPPGSQGLLQRSGFDVELCNQTLVWTVTGGFRGLLCWFYYRCCFSEFLLCCHHDHHRRPIPQTDLLPLTVFPHSFDDQSDLKQADRVMAFVQLQCPIVFCLTCHKNQNFFIFSSFTQAWPLESTW